MLRRTILASVLTLLSLLARNTVQASDAAKVENDKKLKILLVAGGCCHDYATQTKQLKEGIEERLKCEVIVEYSSSKTAETTFKIYESDNWAEGYDCILHDECSARVVDRPYIDRILKAHQAGVPAVNLHCAMHSYRWGDFRQPVSPGAENFAWYEFIGVQSTAHGPQAPIDISFEKHPLMKGFENWTTGDEELYNNIRIYGKTTPLATGKQVQKPRARELKLNPDAKAKEAQAVVVWTNLYGPKETRVFSTTLGHNNKTVGDPRYLDLVVRGIEWATAKK
ncbi:MAG TPA: hypothetical protein DDW52_27480 [Planctomycetaceae bacterium]|nr:hypothetical protein [Planctomycetaceae bacterium]